MKIIYHQYLPMLIGIFDSMGVQTDRLRCEVFQNLILSPMNTGVLRPAVATALTVYGIETYNIFIFFFFFCRCNSTYRLRYWNKTFLTSSLPSDSSLQQHLPFTVLKLFILSSSIHFKMICCNSTYRLRYWNLICCSNIFFLLW